MPTREDLQHMATKEDIPQGLNLDVLVQRGIDQSANLKFSKKRFMPVKFDLKSESEDYFKSEQFEDSEDEE